MTYPYAPYKKQMFPYYENKLTKLELKDKQFTCKQFQKVRKISTRKKILQSFGRIGLCLNDKTTACIPKDNLQKICFIVINDYEKENKDLGVGPLNDGYLIGLIHHRLGFKIFYLYNSIRDQFTSFLQFFLKNTIKALTVFYTGCDKNGECIDFSDGILTKSSLNEIIVLSSKGKARVMFIDDTTGSGSVFDVRNGCKNMLSLMVNKNISMDNNADKHLHGIFTFYFCKIIGEKPNITLECLVQKMDESIQRFNEIFICEITDKELCGKPIFFD